MFLKQGKKEGRKEGWMEGRKEGRKERRKEGRKERKGLNHPLYLEIYQNPDVLVFMCIIVPFGP